MRWRPFSNISITLLLTPNTSSPASTVLILMSPISSTVFRHQLSSCRVRTPFLCNFLKEVMWWWQKEIDDVLSVGGNSNSNIISAIIAVITTMDKTYWELLTTLEPRSIELHQHSFRLQNFLSPLQGSSSGYHLRYSFMSLGSSFQAGINLGNLISE